MSVEGVQVESLEQVSYSCVQGWTSGGGPGIIGDDPRFVENPIDGAGDLRLRAESPCIDAGDNTGIPNGTTDLAGNPRFVDDPDTEDTGVGHPPIVDMGAYEFQVLCDADIDESGDVGFADLLAVLANWGPCSRCAEDLDDDDVVGFTDLLIVLASWGPCLQPGACCLPDAPCVLTDTSKDCAALGGSYQGGGSDCARCINEDRP